MAYDVYTLDQLTDLAVATFANLLPDKNVARNSDNWKRLRVLAGMVADLHANIATVYRDALPDTARGAQLDRWGAIYNVPRKAATPASAENSGKIRGTLGSTWTTTDTLVHASGLTFRPTTGGTMGVTGQAIVGIIAIDAGTKTRLSAGEVLTWTSPPLGLEDEVLLIADLDDAGEDAEDDGAYAIRILNRIGQPAMGGNANDWEQWTLESADYIATAYVYPNRNGIGSVDIAALKAGTGAARLLDVSERGDLLDVLG